VSTARRERLAALDELGARACACVRCPELVRSRTQVIFGGGPPGAQLMFVGEAPGTSEDREGVPLAGAASRLLDELLAGIGLRRDEVAVVTLVKCRPPDNRNPLRAELESCQEYLFGQLELLEPAVVCPLGSFATRVLRRESTPITRLRGTPEIRAVGPRTVRLYPLLHPAAALYSPASVEQLRADVARIPGLLALGAPEQPEPVPEPVAEDPPAPEPPEPAAAPPEPDDPQLGLF
jgi:uracil-DNA glycosylase family 4